MALPVLRQSQILDLKAKAHHLIFLRNFLAVILESQFGYPFILNFYNLMYEIVLFNGTYNY